METQRVGWIGTHIESFKVVPSLAKYPPGTDVYFEGKLIIHGWPDWFPGGDQPIQMYQNEAYLTGGKTGPDGIFRIIITVPYTPGLYSYRAYYPGSGWPAGWDPCSSDSIVVTSESEVPPPVYTCTKCGQTFSTAQELADHMETAHPGIIPPIPPMVIYAGVIAVGVVGLALAVRWARRRK